MNLKNVFAVILLAFVAVSVGVLILNEYRSKLPSVLGPIEEPAPIDSGTQSLPIETDQASDTDITPIANPDLSPDRLTVTYFHGIARCGPCITMERYTHEVVVNDFADSVENGTIEWRVVDFDEPENQHFLDDYGIYTQSVVITEVRDGSEVRFKNLEKIWSLYSDETEYKTYIHDEINDWLEGAE